MSATDFIKNLEEKAATLESSLQQTLANHNFILGQLNLVKELLDKSKPVPEIIAEEIDKIASASKSSKK